MCGWALHDTIATLFCDNVLHAFRGTYDTVYFESTSLLGVK